MAKHSMEMAHISAGYAAYFKGEPQPDRKQKTKAFCAGWMIALQSSRKRPDLPAGNRVRRRIRHVD
jgi:hypothetical protein